MQNQSLPNYIRAAGLATGIFGKETNVNDDNFVSPGWDRFFVLGGQSEGHYYADWFNDDGRRYTAKSTEYMTDLIANRSIVWMSEQIAKKQPFFAYIAPHAPHTRATPAPGSDGYFWDWKAPRLKSWNQAGAHKVSGLQASSAASVHSVSDPYIA
jgi:N-acetylglucosamine-6-sulfatase